MKQITPLENILQQLSFDLNMMLSLESIQGHILKLFIATGDVLYTAGRKYGAAINVRLVTKVTKRKTESGN